MGVLLLVRHGQASFGADDYDVLSEAGWEQGRALGRWLAAHGPTPGAVVHGGMRRHRETWEAMVEGASSADGPRLEQASTVDEDWAEFDHLAVLARHAELTGVVMDHGVDRRAFQEHFEVSTGHWAAAGPDAGYPEPYDAFLTRARRALDAAAALPGPAVVVTSGGVIAALAALLVVPEGADVGPVWARFNTVIANTSVTRVIVGATGARLLTFNEHPHVPREMVTYR
ncbi:broad specificity phosphatase PhoE [Nocardioides sp. J9]|uniref:histidine phosphatase family protein n=1 Tax=unclassified Nocardioides TaxID=2615069 RepID=UPI00048E6470|nr:MULTISPECIES: histidine phosphatase family protein [unclassified Nocardioides]TWG98160.1 broad specificity phosphatase PhoE [Nocardioides sp. J9]